MVLRCQRSGYVLPVKRQVVSLITSLGLSQSRPIVRPRLHITLAYGTKTNSPRAFLIHLSSTYNTFLVFAVLIYVKYVSIGFFSPDTKFYLPESDRQHKISRSNHAFTSSAPTSPHPFYNSQLTIGVELRVFQIF